MDTKSLVVGQDVYMVSGVYCDWGKVTKIMPSVKKNFVEVLTRDGKIILFDHKSIAYDGSHTYECGLWELADKSAEIRNQTTKPKERD